MELVFSSSLHGLQALGTAIHTLNKWQPFTTKFSQNSFVFFFFFNYSRTGHNILCFKKNCHPLC